MKRILYIITLIVLTSLSGCDQDSANHSENKVDTSNKLELKFAGYDYDRVQAIINGKVTHQDIDVSFSVENIYGVSNNLFGPEKKYDVSEIGLIPFITRYINNDFRDYTLIPVFISRTFRHRNIFVHVDSVIEKP